MGWIRQNPRPHTCARTRPQGDFQRGDLWRCDGCQRLWRVGHIGGPPFDDGWHRAFWWTRLRYWWTDKHTVELRGINVVADVPPPKPTTGPPPPYND